MGSGSSRLLYQLRLLSLLDVGLTLLLMDLLQRHVLVNITIRGSPIVIAGASRSSTGLLVCLVPVKSHIRRSA